MFNLPVCPVGWLQGYLKIPIVFFNMNKLGLTTGSSLNKFWDITICVLTVLGSFQLCLSHSLLDLFCVTWRAWREWRGSCFCVVPHTYCSTLGMMTTRTWPKSKALFELFKLHQVTPKCPGPLERHFSSFMKCMWTLLLSGLVEPLHIYVKQCWWYTSNKSTALLEEDVNTIYTNFYFGEQIPTRMYL